MSGGSLDGWVIVVAGNDLRLGEIASAAYAAGALVAVVSANLDEGTPATVRFRADPGDPDAWQRIAMHVEQHLGPIDGVITDQAARNTVREVFSGDLSRRGRAPVLVADPADSPEAVVTALCGRLPAEPSRPAPEALDR